MADQGVSEYWGDKHKPFVPAWTNDAELAQLANAIVRGASVCHAIVPDLRKLIEAVQGHPVARLAEIGPDGEPTIDGPTEITLHGGEVLKCDCNKLTIGVDLTAAIRFTGDAEFCVAIFSGHADFGGAIFTGDAEFWDATFTGGANFWLAIFSGDAEFWGATFTGNADFEWATFSRGADFGEAMRMTFSSHNEDFWRSTVSGDEPFRRSTFSGDARFASITLERRLLLHEATFEPTARLSFHDAYLRPGSEITMPHERIKHKVVHDWLTTDNNIWFDESLCTNKDHSRRVRLWCGQYCFVAAIAPIVEIDWPWLRKMLGMNASGTLIGGEDSSYPAELLRAAADYNRLRDNFRHQSSTDELEDLCHFRYMDLRRRAGKLWMQAGPLLRNPKWRYERPARQTPLKWLQWIAFDGILYWLIWRNCLGYLVRPMRPLVTGFLVILLGWAIYAFGASNDTILYNGPLADGQSAMDVWNGTMLTPLYFSVTTFTTLGYGDFAPTGWLRFVAGLQALIGVGLIALFTVSWGRKMIR